MTAIEEAAEVLNAHLGWHHLTTSGWNICNGCDAVLDDGNKRAVLRALAAHQANMLAEAGLLSTPTNDLIDVTTYADGPHTSSITTHPYLRGE